MMDQFEYYVRHLVYDIIYSQPVNEEALSLRIPLVHMRFKSDFSNYFISASEHFGQHLIVKKSDPTMGRFIFQCSVKDCGMVIVFHDKYGDNKVRINEEHSNFVHDEKKHDIHPHKSRMKETTYNEFIETSKLHSNVKLFVMKHPELRTFPRQSLYNINCNINKCLNSLDEIEKELNKHDEFSTIILQDQEGRLCEIITINKLIVKSSYCDILIVDDTVGVNSYDYPAYCVVCKDPNDHIQIVAFGYLANKTEEAFELFLKNFKLLAEQEREKNRLQINIFGRIFVCDRSKPQSNAIQKVFPQSKIIYCMHHVMMNIENKHYKELTHIGWKMFLTRTKDAENDYINEVAKLPDEEFKGYLIKDMKFYLPSVVDKYYHRFTLTSNAAETTFSVLKGYTQVKKNPLLSVINYFIEMALRWIIESSRLKIQIPLFLEGRVNEFIGKFALDYIKEEFSKIAYIKRGEICTCNKETTKLPCCHNLANNLHGCISIPEEYLRLRNDILEKIIFEKTECQRESYPMKDIELDLQRVVDTLKGMEGTLFIRNQMAYMGMTYLQFGNKYPNSKSRMWNPVPGSLKFSSNCTKARDIWKVKTLTLRKFETKDKVKLDKKPKKS